MRVAFVTCKQLPESDPDQDVLVATARAAGLDARLAAWDDAAVEWSAFGACVLRSTWNYHLSPGDFLSWMERVDAVTRVWNPVEMVRWNSHKSYLLELSQQGFSTVPTRLLQRHEEAALAETMTQAGWEQVVIKPAISAASHGAMRVDRGTVEVGEAHLHKLLRAGDVLVQQYLSSVESMGERALIWIDGVLTHAMQKHPRFDGEEERVEGPVTVEADEEELARALMRGPGRGALYGRVDLARDAQGSSRLMELELIEPSLYFVQEPSALARFVAAISRRGSS
jgi:glutathione synthase/RimK-type ligase-like ATP-grasp enzyme